MKKADWIKPIIITTILILIGLGCKKEELESHTQPVSNLCSSGATLNGTVNPNGLSTNVTFEYGTTTSYGSIAIAYQSPLAGDSVVNVSTNISGLTIGMTYHFRVKAENSHWTVYGKDTEFEFGYPPSGSTLKATNLTSTIRTLNGIVNARNLPTNVTFEYGTTTTYDNTVTASQSPVTGSSIEGVSAEIAGLKPCTTYHFRVKAENGFGISYGSDTTFYTSELPTLSTTSISGITSTTAITGGNISDDGCPNSAINDRGVEWWKIKVGGNGKPPNPSIHHYTHNGTGTGSFTSKLTGLLPSTTYYVRAYATNNAGTVNGNLILFTTPGIGK